MDALAAQEVMEQIHNRFVRDEQVGTFTVSGGYLYPLSLADGQWYWIEGSLFNDGLHQYAAEASDTSAIVDSAIVGAARVGEGASDSDLVDETFTGRILSVVPPKTFVALVEEMQEWVRLHPPSSSGYVSESFGGYSYSLPTNSETGMAATVYDVFASRLTKWRRLPCL